MAFIYSSKPITIPKDYKADGWKRYMSFHTKSYTIKDFCKENPTGKYFVGTKKRVVAVEDSNYYGFFDNGNEEVTCFYTKE